MKFKYYLVDKNTGEKQECNINPEIKVSELKQWLKEHSSQKLESEIVND